LEDREQLPKREILFRIAFTLFLYRKERREVFAIIHEICEVRCERRRRINKLRRKSNNSDAVRLRRIAARRF
jgi:hypothetical protein